MNQLVFSQASLIGLVHPIRFSAAATPSSYWTQPLKDVVFTVLDTEATGLNSDTESLTEVAAIQYKNGQELARLNFLVKPEKPIPEKIERLTHISNEMVQNAIGQKEALEKLCDFLGPNPVLVGDFIDFDMKLIRSLLSRYQMPHYQDRFMLDKAICTRTLAQKLTEVIPDQDYQRLFANVPQLPAHRAENDVRNAAQFLFTLLDNLSLWHQPAVTLGDLKGFQGEPVAYRGY